MKSFIIRWLCIGIVITLNKIYTISKLTNKTNSELKKLAKLYLSVYNT